MFTGLIEETGTVKSLIPHGKGGLLTIEAEIIFEDLKLGDSIAVNGVCLTADEISGNAFTAFVMAETLRRTNLGSLKKGSSVNLERAMAAGGRFGGHIVSGHVDGTGVITSYSNEGDAVWVTVRTSPEICRYIVEKGSVTIDGISLTVAKCSGDTFAVSIIPHTGGKTTLLKNRQGSSVNLECDIVGKYVEKFVTEKKGNGITMEFLAEHGF